MWQMEMFPYAKFGGGPERAIYGTRDGGRNWRKLVDLGRPHSPVGKIDVAVVPSNSKRIYALV
jgi:hypothetical protein